MPASPEARGKIAPVSVNPWAMDGPAANLEERESLRKSGSEGKKREARAMKMQASRMAMLMFNIGVRKKS